MQFIQFIMQASLNAYGICMAWYFYGWKLANPGILKEKKPAVYQLPNW